MSNENGLSIFFAGLLLGLIMMGMISVFLVIGVMKSKMELYIEQTGGTEIIITDTRVECEIEGAWLISGKEIIYTNEEGQRKTGNICESFNFVENK